MVSVTSADLQKRFGPIREKALRGPVSVTHHGRESLVLVSAIEFNRLKAMDTRRAYRIEDLPEEWGEALMSAQPAPECPAP